MKTLYVNKMQHFIVLSILVHLLLFVAFLSFAKLNKEHKELEIFIVNDVVRPLKESTKTSSHVIKKHTQIQTTVTYTEKITLETKTEQTFTNYPYSHSESSEKNHGTYVARNKHEEISSTTDKGGIIDTEFGTAYGPKFIHREIPVYPQIARRLGKEGKVILKLTLNEKGELMDVEIIEGAPYGFTESAIEAVKKSKFSPAIKNGKPIACRAVLPIRFILKN